VANAPVHSAQTSLPQWHLAMLIAIVHAASGELQARRLPDAAIETALVATLLGARSASACSEGESDESS
jgi:hypothetical protein